MLARTILVLSCLLSTRVLAQAPADNTSAPPADATSTSASASATTGANVGANASGNTANIQDAAGAGTPKAEESVEAAVPVDREALSPADEHAAPHALESDPMFTPAVVLVGTGGAALLASLFTGLGAHGIYKSLELDCKNDICSSDKEQRISSGKALATVSTVLTGVGIVAAGIGATLLILAATHDDKPPPQSNFGFAKLQLTSGPTPLGIGARGSF